MNKTIIPKVEIPIFNNIIPIHHDDIVPIGLTYEDGFVLETYYSGCNLKMFPDKNGFAYYEKTYEKTIEEKVQEMTIEEIEKKLGYKVKIVGNKEED